MRLPAKDSSTFRGIITALQTFIGASVVFATGLVGVIHGVPGCFEAVMEYFKQNAIQLGAFLGVGSGIVSFLWNVFFRKDVKNY